MTEEKQAEPAPCAGGGVMDDAKAGYQATPNATLEDQLMSLSYAKTEREWWAMKEISRLRAEVDALKLQRTAAELVHRETATTVLLVGQFDHLVGLGMHELRTDELAQYVVSLAHGHGPSSPVVMAALDWIVSELERKTNDERALAVKLDAILAARWHELYDVAPKQAEPVKGVVWQDDGAALIKRGDEDAFCARHSDARRLYLHPPADEVQRLRAALECIEKCTTDQLNRVIARRALDS